MVFSMEVPDVAAISKEVASETKVAEADLAKRVQESKQEDVTDPILVQAKNNALAIMSSDLSSPDAKRGIIKSIDAVGKETMLKSQGKNQLMRTTIGKLSESGADGGEVARSLVELNAQIKDLDPGALDFTKTGLLGKLTNPIRAYFAKYEKADSVIENIIKSLERGQSTLKNDNVTLEREQQALWELTRKLAKEIELAAVTDNALVEQIELAKLQDADPDTEKIKFVEEEILFPLRQNIMDMQSLIAVNQQGIIGMEVVRRNNKELIRGVDRAKMVTVNALRTAVMVAGALYNQKLVLQKINALNATTNHLITSTSRMLKEQGTAIHQQAVEATISVDSLKNAFADVFEAVEEISNFKQKALPQMQKTIEDFRELADQGEKRLQKIEKAKQYSLTDGE